MKKTRLLPLLSILLLASCETGISSAEPSTGSSSVSEPSANDPSSVLPSSTEPSTPEPSTPTPPPEPVTPTVDLVAESIQTLIDSTLLSYTYSIRVYQDNYITGDVIQNMRETTIIDSYVNAYDGIVTTEEFEGVLEPTTTSTQTARVASYRLDEESYIRGLISDGANHDGDFAEILEINRYSDVNSMEARIFQPVQRSALSAFSDPEAYYPADMGFTLGETVIEETDTSFVVTISGSAEEDPIRYYAREEDEIAVEIDKYTAEVRSITITTFLYDMGYTGELRHFTFTVTVQPRSLADGGKINKIIWPSGGLVTAITSADGRSVVPSGGTRLSEGQVIEFECSADDGDEVLDYLYTIVGKP